MHMAETVEDGKETTWAYYFPQAGTNFMLRLGLEF
jgi:hypothetical protein